MNTPLPAEAAEIAGEAFAAGFKAALTKVKPEMRALEVMMVHADQWSLYQQSISAAPEPSTERKWLVVERQVNEGDREAWRKPWCCEYAPGSWCAIAIKDTLVKARNHARWAARIYKGHAVRVVEVFERRTILAPKRRKATATTDPAIGGPVALGAVPPIRGRAHPARLHGGQKGNR